MKSVRVLIVDDHEIFRKGLRSLLESHDDLQICGEAANGLEAIEKAEDLRPDVVLMDISLPLMGGLQAAQLIRDQLPDTHILVLTQHDSALMLSAALKAGASAYVTKSQVSQCLIAAVQSLIGDPPPRWNASGAANQQDTT